MSMLDELLKGDAPANPANPANRDQPRGEISRISKISKEAYGKNTTCDRLLSLGKTGGFDAALVEALDESDLADVADESDRALLAYLSALNDTAAREAGRIPDTYTQVAHCRGCGPVWLFVSGEVAGCPWCFNRLKGLPIPRPPRGDRP